MTLARLRPAIACLSLLFMLTGCAVTFLSNYDERTDELTSNLQRNMAAHFEELGTATQPGCLYDNYRDFYRERRVDLNALDLRVRSIPQNAPTIDQVATLMSSLRAFEQLHQLDSAKPECLSQEEISPVARAFGQQFLAIMTLELAKKRGED